MVFYPRLIAKVFECIIVELFSIVRDEDSRNPEPANDSLPDKATSILLCDGCQWFYFYPFDEVVNLYN